MKQYKNFFQSKTIIAILCAIILSLCKQYNVDIPLATDDTQVLTIMQYVSFVLALIFRTTATKKIA